MPIILIILMSLFTIAYNSTSALAQNNHQGAVVAPSFRGQVIVNSGAGHVGASFQVGVQQPGGQRPGHSISSPGRPGFHSPGQNHVNSNRKSTPNAVDVTREKLYQFKHPAYLSGYTPFGTSQKTPHPVNNNNYTRPNAWDKINKESYLNPDKSNLERFKKYGIWYGDDTFTSYPDYDNLNHNRHLKFSRRKFEPYQDYLWTDVIRTDYQLNLEYNRLEKDWSQAINNLTPGIYGAFWSWLIDQNGQTDDIVIQKMFKHISNNLLARLKSAPYLSKDQKNSLVMALIRDFLANNIDSISIEGDSYYVKFNLNSGGKSPWTYIPTIFLGGKVAPISPPAFIGGSPLVLGSQPEIEDVSLHLPDPKESKKQFYFIASKSWN